ncbi:hypothetical protein quinque_005550 [Culex quinquefasciatus]
MLMGQFTETRAMIDGLRNDINTKIDAVKSDLEEKLNDVKLDINSLKVECTTKFATNDAALKSINDRLGSVSQNVGALEFRNELIISGIPFQSGENLYAYLQEISRDEVYSAYMRRCDLKLRHLGLNSDRRVYINENLDTAARKLKSAALRLKKAGKVASVYTSKGIVYVKQAGGTSSVAVFSEEDLNKFTTEGLALDLHVAGHRLLLFVVYNPPGNDCSNFLETKLAELATKYEDILLIGDFNTDLLRPSNKRSQFESVLRNFSICPVSEEATYFHNNGCSQLDLLLTTSAEKVLRFGQVSFPGLSQHDLIFASLDFDVAEPLTTTTYRDYVNFDAQSLKDAVLCIPWNRFYEFSEPEESVDFFTDQLKTVHDAYIPLRTRSNRKKANAWFTATVQRSMLERDLAYKDWQHATPDSKAQKRQLYNFLRNRANALVKRAKEQHLNGFLSNTNSNTLWKRVRSLGIGKEKAQHVCEFDPDQINQMFLSNFTVNSTGDGFSRRRLPTPFNFSFRPVQYWEVVRCHLRHWFECSRF